MKRFLSVGEGYGLFRWSLVYAFSFVITCTYSCSTFRSAEFYVGRELENIGIYTIGDKLPRNFVIGYDPFDTTSLRLLSDLQGKAVVLDVWATWCGSCISKFPLMDSLQKQYKQDLEIVFVNAQGRDTPEIVRNFLTEYRSKNPDIDLPVVIERSPLVKYFAFNTIPHYIWIDGNRRVCAFTDIDAFTEENLQRLFAGLPLYIPMKLR